MGLTLILLALKSNVWQVRAAGRLPQHGRPLRRVVALVAGPRPVGTEYAPEVLLAILLAPPRPRVTSIPVLPCVVVNIILLQGAVVAAITDVLDRALIVH